MTAVGNAQVDTGYTIIETVPENQFLQLINKESEMEFKFKDFTGKQLDMSLSLNDHEQTMDERNGHVFVRLETAATLERYSSQFKGCSQLFSEYKNLRCVLVNERYLRGKKEDKQLAKGIILIDSKGIDQFGCGINNLTESANESKIAAHAFSDIRMMSQIVKMSEKMLFLIPSLKVKEVRDQIQVLELSVLGEEFLDEIVRANQKKVESSEKKESDSSEVSLKSSQSPSVNIPGLLIPNPQEIGVAVGYAVKTALGVDELIGIAKNLGSIVQKKIGNYFSKSEKVQKEKHMGNARWSKVSFIITQIDHVLINAKKSMKDPNEELHQVFYELGATVGNASFLTKKNDSLVFLFLIF